MIRPYASPDADDRMGEIAMLAVDPPYRRRGVGGRLTTVATE